MTCASNWTVWRKLVDADDDKHYNLENVVDKKHPACYQLAIGGPRGGNIKIKYVGYTGNLTERMTSYGNHGSHIAKHIDSAIEEGDSIFYRYKKCNTENQAWECEQRQLSRLKKRMKFMWNKVGSQ